MHAAAGDCAAAVARVRTGMACVTCWSFSLVGAGSSARAWLNLVCWLLILIRARSLEHRRLGRPRPSRSLASHTLCERRVTGGTEAPEATCTCVDGEHVRTATQTPHTLQDLGSICPYLPESGIRNGSRSRPRRRSRAALASDGRRAARRRRDSANHTSSGRSSNCAAHERYNITAQRCGNPQRPRLTRFKTYTRQGNLTSVRGR